MNQQQADIRQGTVGEKENPPPPSGGWLQADFLRWLALSTFILLIDQVTKFAVANTLRLHEAVEVTPFFNLVFVYNPGAAFSFLADQQGWQKALFIAIGVAASVWIVHLLHKHPRRTLFCVAISLILAGALGNVIDRLLFGAVVDFLDFHAHGWHWPAFNVADSAITCGAALLVIESFRPGNKS